MAFPRPLSKTESTPGEVELKIMWQEAEVKFRQMTRKNLRADPEKQLTDVIREFERRFQPKDSEERSNKAKMGATIKKILDCVQLLGGIAAQSVSVVFGPATLCFNAISFLLDVPGKIASVYEGIGRLFDEIAHVLSLFRIYGNYTKIDPELRDSTHKIMASLVGICALSIKIIDGGILGKIKVGLKATFLRDDSGVQDELTRFKALIDNQSRITEATTLEHVLTTEENTVELLRSQYISSEKLSNVETGVNVLVADMNDRKTERLISLRAETIEKILSMRRESYQDDRMTLQKMKEELFEGSSQWLLEQTDYKDWINQRTDADPVLFIAGEPRTGKSFLLASIDEDVRKSNPDIAVAYHAFTGRDGKSTRDKNDNELVSALKSMALQIANQNKTYAKEIEGMKDTDFKPSEAQKEIGESQIWTKLKFSNYFDSKESIDIVLMFDGLDEVPEHSARKFLELLRSEGRSAIEAHKMRPRIVVTGREAFAADSTVFFTAENNQPDIKLFLERELSKAEDLQGQHVEMKDLLKTIRSELPLVAKGSFSSVQQKLARLREAVESDAYLDDLTKIIEQDPAEDLDKIAQKIISDCYAASTAHDVKQLNELLSWTTFGRSMFSIEELRAALFLSSGRSPLQPFEKKLRKKYARIFAIDGRYVTAEQTITDYVLQTSSTIVSNNAAVSDLNGAKITMTISINEADLRTTQQFLWDLTERVGIGRFDFFTANTEASSKGIIRCNEADSHHHIAEQLLKLLNDEPNVKTNDLVEYALNCLPLHLQKVKEALNKGQLGVVARKSIAKRLVDLLSDIDAIEKFWDASKFWGVAPTTSDWIDNEAVDTIRDWLTDEATIALLEPKERRWAKQHTADSEGKAGFFKPFTLMMCRRWLQDRTWDPYSSFDWIDKFIKMQTRKEDTGDESASKNDSIEKQGRSLEDQGNPATSLPLSLTADLEVSQKDNITSAATWARQALNVKDEDSLWFERVGQTCYLVKEYDAAMEWYEKAKNLPGCHWKVHEGQALVLADLGKTRDSIQMMEAAITNLRSDSHGDEPDETRLALIQNLGRLASWQSTLDLTESVSVTYKEILEIDPDNHRSRYDLMKYLHRLNREDEARSTLISLPKSVDEAVDLEPFVRLLQYLTADEDNSAELDLVAGLARTNERFDQHVLQAFRDAINNTRKSDLVVNRGVLLLYQGILLARNATDDLQFQQALQSWEECNSLQAASVWDLYTTHLYAARNVGRYHFGKAIKANVPIVERDHHFNRMLKMSRIASATSYRFRPTSFIASCYVHRDQPKEAQKVFMEDMMDGLAILSDQDPDNDVYGYKLLANILMHTGDDLNALSAWSLLGPHDAFTSEASTKGKTEAEDNLSDEATAKTSSPQSVDGEPQIEAETSVREGPLTYSCDGRCDHEWTYANDMYCCRYCPDTQFNHDCLEKLKSDTLLPYTCSPNHSWLHVPAWSDKEALAVGKGNVRVGGTLVDGKRVGGEVVKVGDWLDGIREAWGIPKTTVEAAS